MRRLLLLTIPLLFACGEDRGGSGTRILGFDGGGFLDAGAIRDAGFVGGDSGVVGPNDSGVENPRDSGQVGTPDAGMVAVPLTVQDCQDMTRPNWPGEGARVRLDNVVVTSMFPAGDQMGSFHVQMPSGGPYSGILVFIPTGVVAPTVAIGDRVTVVGALTEFFDVTEITFESLIARAPGAPLTPQIVVPDSIATGAPNAEAYEGVLVRVSNVQVTSANPDFPNDFGEFEVTGGLRVDDGIYRLEPRPTELSTIEYVIGVHHHAFSTYKLLPRGPADIGPIF